MMKNKYAYRLEEMTKFIAHLETYFGSFSTSTFLPQILNSANETNMANMISQSAALALQYDSRGMTSFSRYSSDGVLPSTISTSNSGLSATSMPFMPSSAYDTSKFESNIYSEMNRSNSKCLTYISTWKISKIINTLVEPS
jgi:hypothetical protein